jgi:FKBP-type peptidyl-prolyl cis-trans isomerase
MQQHCFSVRVSRLAVTAAVTLPLAFILFGCDPVVPVEDNGAPTPEATATAAANAATPTPAPKDSGAAFSPTAKTVTLPDGLKYQDVVVGHGDEAKKGDNVAVQYLGTLADNTKFDASTDRGPAPFVFQLGMGSVIPGWDEGVAGMKVGGERKLLIPSALGYGDHGQGAIPPGATLQFDVKLLHVSQRPGA